MKKYLTVWFLCLALIVSLCNVSYARTTVGSSPTIDASTFTISPDGTSTNPSITFWNERTLGFYRSSTGVISLTGGTLSMLGGSYSLTDSDVAHGMTDIAATNVYGLLNALDAADKGGLRIQGLSDGDAIPLYIRGIIGSNNPTDTLEAISIIAAKKNGTGVQALGSVETALQLLNNTTELLTILGSGAFLISDNANTKNLAGLTVNQLTSDDETFSFKSSDVGHSFTTDTELDTFLYGKKLSATLGGVGLWGLSDGDATGLQLTGAIGIADPTNTIPAIIINGVKLNGTTYGTVGNDETVAQITNNGTALTTWLGNGNIGIGTGTFGTSAAKVMSFSQWTAPTTSPADVTQLGAADMQSAPGMTRLHQRTEAGITSPLALHDEVNALANPRRPSQAVNMLAAASGSTGITRADDANLDFGTGNYSLAFKGSIPDWTPAATVVLAQKTDGTNGWNLQVLTTGIIRLTINVTNYDSTVAPVITDGMIAKIGVSVTRETASVAGSVVFYFNGTQLGASVAIGAGAPTTVNNASALYVLGTSSTRTAGQAHFFVPFNYALSAAQQLSLFRKGVDFIDQYQSPTAVYTSNFSAGTDSWGSNDGANITLDGNQDAVNGSDDWLKVTRVNSIGRADIRRLTTLNMNRAHRVDITIFNPTGSGISYFLIKDPAQVNSIAVIAVAENTEVTVSRNVVFTSGNITATQLYVSPCESNQSNKTDVAVNAYWYMKTVVVYYAGAVAAYEPEGIQSTGWLDSSTNYLDLSYPAAGSSLVRKEEIAELTRVKVITYSATGNVSAYQMAGQSGVITGAYTLSLPTATVGFKAKYTASTAAVFSLDLQTGSDVIVLNGTALAAGNKATSDGTIYNTVEVECIQAGKYMINSIIGTASDGGA